VILQLRQGDRVEILEDQNGILKIRYRIDGDFPVEGYITKEAVSETVAADSLKPPSVQYEALAKESPTTQQSELSGLQNSQVLQPNITSRSELKSKPVRPATKRDPGPWLFEVQPRMGLDYWSESLTTKYTADQTKATEPFLEYEMAGIQMGVSGRAGYQWPTKWELGVFGSYGISFLRGSVPGASNTFDPQIEPGNVKATLHDLQMGPYFRRPYLLTRGWSVIPEIKILGGLHFFQTNQLQSKADATENVPSQSVLYSYISFLGDLEVSPEVQMPLSFFAKPNLRVNLFQSFSEGPTTEAGLADEDKLRTGSPKSKAFLLSYGITAGWRADSLGMEVLQLSASWQHRDLSKAFSGRGNRAGMATLDAESTIVVNSFSLNVDYLF
jgi:hypothetical protein